MCVSSHVRACVFMWVPAYKVQRLASKISLEYSPLTLSLLTQVDWPAINPPGTLLLPQCWTQVSTTTFSCFTWVLRDQTWIIFMRIWQVLY